MAEATAPAARFTADSHESSALSDKDLVQTTLAAATTPLLNDDGHNDHEAFEMTGMGDGAAASASVAAAATASAGGRPVLTAVRSAARLVKRFSTGAPSMHSRHVSEAGTTGTRMTSPFELVSTEDVHAASSEGLQREAYVDLETFLRGIGISSGEAEVYAKELVTDFHIRRADDLDGRTVKELRAMHIPYTIHRNLIAYAFPRVGTHAEVVQRVCLMLWFLCIISLGMIYQRLLCNSNLPFDCNTINTPEAQLQVVNTIILVYEKALLLFFLGQIGRYQLTRWYFYVAYIGIFPLFGYLGSVYPDVYLNANNLEAQAQQALAPRIWALIAIVGAFVLVLVVLHIYLAYRYSIGYMIIYLTSLVAIASVIVALYALISSTRVFYIHHWFIFWMLAIFTRFNHPLSVIALGLCIGIFVQGAAAYGADNVAFI